MEVVSPTELIPGQKYYIKSVSNKNSRQIGVCEKVTHIKEDLYYIHFLDISEIKKTNGYGDSGLHYGEGFRHSKWFIFYKVHSIEYCKKIENIYKKSINIYLQRITNDHYFYWYT